MFERNPQAPYASPSAAIAYDEGLRSHFRQVYNTMSIGLVVTGLVAMIAAQMPAVTALFKNPVTGLIIAFLPLVMGMVLFRGSVLMQKTAADLNVRFYLFSGVFGFCLTPLVMVYAGADLARAFFITAATFAATSAYGYITKTDLSKFRSFLIMGAIGLLIAMVVNMFLQSSIMDFVISCVGVLVYTGLTAYDTQNIKETYAAGNGMEANGKMAVLGALGLYMNFIMLFQFILSLVNNRD